MLLSWFLIRSFLGGKIAVDFRFLFWGIRISGVTLAPITYKRETLAGIFYTNNIYCSSDGSNLLIIVDILVTFFVLVYYLVVLSISALGVKNYSFAFSILSLGDNESLVASLSSKSSLAWYFRTSDIGWNSVSSIFFHYQSGLQRIDMFLSLDLQYSFDKVL